MTYYVPKRGDVVWLSFSPQAGREQAGRRPAFTVSPRIYNERVGLALFCPLTRQVKGYPFEVLIPIGFPVQGVILADQVRSLDWVERQAHYITTLPDHITLDVIARIRALLD